MIDTDLKPCHDCAAAVGQPHTDGCDTARCLWTGGQRLQCEMGTGIILDPDPDSEAVLLTTGPRPDHDCGHEVWTGVWPGVAECQEFGWYCYFVPKAGWVRCEKDDPHPDVTEDLNRLYMSETEWSRDQGRWVLR